MTFFISTKYSMQMPFPEVGRWHLVFRVMPQPWKNGAVEVVVGFFKLHTIPPPGEMMQSYHYKGFLYARDFHWTLTIAGGWNLPTGDEVKSKWKNMLSKMSAFISSRSN